MENRPLQWRNVAVTHINQVIKFTINNTGTTTHYLYTDTDSSVYNMTYEMLLPKMLEDTIKQTQDMTVGLDSSN